VSVMLDKSDSIAKLLDRSVSLAVGELFIFALVADSAASSTLASASASEPPKAPSISSADGSKAAGSLFSAVGLDASAWLWHFAKPKKRCSDRRLAQPTG